MADPVPAHRQDRTLHESTWDPEHPHRSASAEYRRVHHHLVVELDESCWICGMRNSTLKDPTKNLTGARDMETRH
jgi:hypothetical protein